MKNMIEELKSYKCIWCGDLHSTEVSADLCSLNHAKYNLANSALNAGLTLGYINMVCNFNWKLSGEQKDITKDNCFVVSHWQCTDKPIYKIIEIRVNGYFKLWGKNASGGYYGDYVDLSYLKTPYPKEELFIYKD